MKVAVTYNPADGEIFQHFGKTPAFLFAEVEGGKVLSCREEPTGGSGHSALLAFLQDRKTDAVICGGIGPGARDALASGGIQVTAGQSGSAEAALQFFANGDLRDAGGTCSHSHGEGHSCGEHDAHSCGHSHDGGGPHGCGSCGG